MTKNKRRYNTILCQFSRIIHKYIYSVGGAGSSSLSHPLDSVKVKMQTFPHLYRGGIHCMREVIQQDGIRGLYRGLLPGVILSMTEASIRYMTYGICQVCSVTVMYSFMHSFRPFL